MAEDKKNSGISDRDRERREDQINQKQTKRIVAGLANVTKELTNDNQKAFEDFTGKFTDAVKDIPEQMRDFSKGFLKTVAMSNPIAALGLGASFKALSNLGNLFVASNDEMMEEEDDREAKKEAKTDKRENKKIGIFERIHNQMALVHSELEMVHDALLSAEEAEQRRFERAERQRQEAENKALFARATDGDSTDAKEVVEDSGEKKKSGLIGSILRMAGIAVMKVITPFMSALQFLGKAGKGLLKMVPGKAVLGKLVSFLGGVFGFFADAEAVFGEDLGFTGKDLGKRIIGAVVGLFKAIPLLIGNVMDIVFNMVTGGSTDMFSEAVNIIADGVLGFFGNLIDYVFGSADEQIEASNVIGETIDNLFGFIGYVIGQGMQKLSEMGGNLGNFITELPDIGTLINMAIGKIMSGIPDWMINALPDRWASQIQEWKSAYGEGSADVGPDLDTETRTVESEDGRFQSMDDYEAGRRQEQEIIVPPPVVSVTAPQQNSTTVLAPGGGQRNDDITVRRKQREQNAGY